MLYANHPEPQQAHQRNREALMQALTALSIQKALVTYSGSGVEFRPKLTQGFHPKLTRVKGAQYT